MKKIPSFLLKTYNGNPNEEILFVRQGVDNDMYSFFDLSGQKKIIRVSRNKSIKDVKKEKELLEELYAAGAKVLTIVKSVNNREVTILNGQPVICFNYIENDPRVDSNEVYQAGLALGEFHTVSKNIHSQLSRTLFTEYDRALKNQEIIPKTFIGGQEFILDVKRTLTLSKEKTAKTGFIHNDFNNTNVLLKNGKVEYIIDFDLSCQGPLIADAAFGSVSWSTKNGEYLPDKNNFHSFVDGYNQSAPIKFGVNTDFCFWAAFSCLSIACDLLCDCLENNTFNITDVNQSWMYQRFRYYISKDSL